MFLFTPLYCGQGGIFASTPAGVFVVLGNAERSSTRVRRHSLDSPSLVARFLPVRIPFLIARYHKHVYVRSIRIASLLWAGRDSNPRRPKSADLQSAAIDRSATYPKHKHCISPSQKTQFLPLVLFLSHLSDSDRRPTVYKTVALPAELRWRVSQHHQCSFMLFLSFLSSSIALQIFCSLLDIFFVNIRFLTNENKRPLLFRRLRDSPIMPSCTTLRVFYASLLPLSASNFSILLIRIFALRLIGLNRNTCLKHSLASFKLSFFI